MLSSMEFCGVEEKRGMREDFKRYTGYRRFKGTQILILVILKIVSALDECTPPHPHESKSKDASRALQFMSFSLQTTRL